MRILILRALTAFCLVLTVAGHAQQLMFMKNRHKIVFYKPGDEISFRVKGQREKIAGTIKAIEDSVVVFRDFRFKPEDVSHMYVDKQTIQWFVLKYKYQRIFLFSGFGFLVADVFNTHEINEGTLRISLPLITAGLIAGIVVNKTIAIKGKRRLVILRKPAAIH